MQFRITCMLQQQHPFLGLPAWASTKKVKPGWVLLKQETKWQWYQLGHSKSAPRPRQIPHRHHTCFFTGRMFFLLPNQQHQRTEAQCLWDGITNPIVWIDILHYSRFTTVSGTIWVSQYQKGETRKVKPTEWQWHQLHMQICISLKTDNYASIPPLNWHILQIIHKISVWSLIVCLIQLWMLIVLFKVESANQN